MAIAYAVSFGNALASRIADRHNDLIIGSPLRQYMHHDAAHGRSSTLPRWAESERTPLEKGVGKVGSLELFLGSINVGQ